ncbi:hypothetical protein AAF712_009002 [Marasmius tenuissimus]|uniref:CxC1-like cysteine cluster associated with KDZ transposases domain-containing protein n=1 Tax=Marasmius tenuissimus TaxID=585030 RepID=A0ABR2ZSG7_9AGAR
MYRQLHCACPSLSIKAYSRALLHLHGKPRRRHLEDQLWVAYDQYLVIQRTLNERIAQALFRNNDDHFVQNICAPCMYELEDEPRLNPRILMVMDGNNSLKMVDADHKRGQARTDLRQLNDPRWLSSIAVNRFKDEVANSQRATKKKLPVLADITSTPGLSAGDSASSEANASTQHHADGNSVPCDPIPGNSGPTLPNAQSETPQLSNPAEEIAWLNVLEEDELMKYPLAITDAILECYGEDIGLGYNIMCAFFKTLQRSGQLGAKVAALQLQGVVLAFHGHAHNRKCQLYWHPTYIPGLGIFNFEESSTTRLATLFHRRQIILEHFNFHSQDKNANFGNWAHQMQKCRELHMDPSDCERLLEEEWAFFMRDFTESPETVQKLDYAELLLKLWTTKALSDEAGHGKRLTIQSRRNAMFTRWSAVNKQVCIFEIDHSIPERWLPHGPEYREALEGLRCWTYQRALDKLEHLVVSRLFELTKLNMSGVSYKQRNKITAALHARADAIKKAITGYNSAALQLNPPRESIDWAQIVEMVSLADFDLLKTLFDIKRACKEIVRLNVEIRRRVTSMLDDSADYYWAEQRDMHSVFCEDIAQRLVETANLHGFSGSLLLGQRLGRDPNITGEAPLPTWATSVLGLHRKSSDVADNSWGADHDDSHPKIQAKVLVHSHDNVSVSDAGSNADEEEGVDPDEGSSDEEDDKAEHLLEFMESLSVQ